MPPARRGHHIILDELQVERGLPRDRGRRRDWPSSPPGGARAWRHDPEPVRDFVNRLRREGRRPSTQARKVAAIRSFYGFALREELADRDVASLLDAPKAGSYLPDVLGPEQVVRILDAPPADNPVGVRDRAILELLYACGLRVSELTGWTPIGSTAGPAGACHRRETGTPSADG